MEFSDKGKRQADAIFGSTWAQFEELTAELEASPSENESSALGFNFLAQGPELLGVVSEDVAGADDGLTPAEGAGVSHAFAAMAVMMLMFNLVSAGGGLLDEEASGSLLRLRLSPAGGLELLFAKLGFVFLVGLMQLGVLFPFGWLAFDLPLTSHLLEVLVISVVLCFAIASMGMVLSLIHISEPTRPY